MTLQRSILGVCLILLTACRQNGVKSTTLNKLPFGGPRVSDTGEKDLTPVFHDSTECLLVDQEVAVLRNRTNQDITVYTNDIDISVSNGQKPADDVTRAKLLVQLKDHIVFDVDFGANLMAMPVVNSLLNILSQKDCDQVQFQSADGKSIDTFTKIPSRAIKPGRPNAKALTGNPTELNLFNNSTGEKRFYSDDGNGNLNITVIRPVHVNGACGASPDVMVRERFVVAHGKQGDFTLALGFARLLQTTLQIPPRELVDQINAANPVKPPVGGNLTRMPAVDRVTISALIYIKIVQSSAQNGQLTSPDCAKGP